MSESPSGPEPWAARLRRLPAQARPAHFVAAVAVAGVFGLNGLAAAPLPGPRALTPGERLQIEVVAPVEPAIVPGSVMEVGDLVDGFQGLPPPLPSVVETVAWVPDDPWGDGRKEPEPPPRPRVEEAVIHVAPQPGNDPARDRWFGFDAPRRDYRAEREARRARIEARIEREREADSRRYWSDPDRRGEDDRWREPRPRDDRPPPDPWD
ncbi:hypothetical protein [Brevundimonas sp.]|uniref:hypothetical protein n=1 Tax=Brevundimonas sp. TaxID=1871086 RepID=UPI00273802B9|nr:hypothetical protein [Brevundimonas sp.]MDP3801708.1 hypothetical protein [Brevundimonas sp.]